MHNAENIAQVFDGWSGYQTSLIHAVEPLSLEHLSWRPMDHRRSVGEVVRHIALGRITWFARMNGPELEAAVARVPKWFTDSDGSRPADEKSLSLKDGREAAEWLAVSWEPIAAVPATWTVADLVQSYPHRFRGTDYNVFRQWTAWRIIAHDIHHGGQIAMMLAIQGISAFELGALGGHIVEPPRLAAMPGDQT